MYRKMDNSDVAHDWANNIDANASASAGNMYHAGGGIYSYGQHFLIAKHVWNARRSHAVLFTERTYSRTTAKHISIVRGASSHLDKLFVPDPALTETEMFAAWQQQIVDIAQHLGDAHKPAKYILQIEQVFYRVKQYADFFDLDIPETLKKVAAVKDNDQFAAYLAEERMLQAQELEKRRKAERSRHQQQLKDWRAFKINRLYSDDGFDHLRLNRKTGSIETTQSVEFPLAAGHQLYQFVNAANAKGGCTDCGESFLGRYPILEINSTFIRIGCHKVSLKEINRFAKQQGWH